MQGDSGIEINERKRLTDSLELLADMGHDFARSLDIEVTLQSAFKRITEYVGAANITGLTLRSDYGIIGRCVQNNAGDIVRDVAKDPSSEGLAETKTDFTTRSILCAPLSVKEKRIGAIELINKHGGDRLFNEADLTLLKVLSSSAILNARLASELVV